MLLKDFYSALDQELIDLIQKYEADDLLRAHKNNLDNQKSYAFLIWFMEFYAKVRAYPPYVTDGRSDHSFDIVFPIPNQIGQKIFYVVQSKWKKTSDKHLSKENGKDEFLRSLQELDTVLRGTIPPDANDRVKRNLEEFNEHRRNNGEVKFIFLTLCSNDIQADIQHNIDTFQQNNPLVNIEVIDIERLRLDYIDKKFKQIDPPNPLLSNFDPLEEMVTLDIVRLHTGDGTFLRVDKPFTAYNLLLRPKTLHALFKKYNYNLFHSNIRNPLNSSNINEDIVKTAIEAPNLFYYYNNGLTALATYIPPVNNQAEVITVKGFQVINGAQTLYSLYHAYEKNPNSRTEMDSNILISLRLIESVTRSISLDITRYTNLQNPIDERDFWSNDPIQIRLQKEFYDLGVIYERRRGEFRAYPPNMQLIENTDFATAYLAVVLQEPYLVEQNYAQLETTQTKKDWQFISTNKEKTGQYELIFNVETNARQMMAAYNIFKIAANRLLNEDSILPKFRFGNIAHSFICYDIALALIIQKKYWELKYNTVFSLNDVLEKLIHLKKNDIILLDKMILYSSSFINNLIETKQQVEKLFNDPHYHKIIVHEFESASFSLNDVDNISIRKKDEQKIEELIKNWHL